MLLRRRRNTTDEPRDDVIVERGPSLAKGPNLILGTILLVYGLSGLLTNADFPSASQNFPGADVTGSSWLGPEVNGWTNFLCIAAGGLLLFGAAQHHLAKFMSLIVGLALAAAAVIGFVDGDVLGLAAANRWTELGWGITAVILLLNVFSPRRVRERPVATTATRDESVPTYARDGDRTAVHDREPATTAMPGGGRADTTADDDRLEHRGRFLRREHAGEPPAEQERAATTHRTDQRG
jgi:hypothetical protein